MEVERAGGEDRRGNWPYSCRAGPNPARGKRRGSCGSVAQKLGLRKGGRMGYRRYGEGALRGRGGMLELELELEKMAAEAGGHDGSRLEPMCWQARHSCDGVEKFGKEGPRRKAGCGEGATEVEICGRLCCLCSPLASVRLLAIRQNQKGHVLFSGLTVYNKL